MLGDVHKRTSYAIVFVYKLDIFITKHYQYEMGKDGTRRYLPRCGLCNNFGRLFIKEKNNPTFKKVSAL